MNSDHNDLDTGVPRPRRTAPGAPAVLTWLFAALPLDVSRLLSVGVCASLMLLLPGSSDAQVDPDLPTVTVTTSATSPVNGEFPVTITFSEGVSGFTGIVVDNGTVEDLTETQHATVWTATIRPRDPGNVTVYVPASAAFNAIGEGNMRSDDLIVEYETGAPTVTISAPEATNAAFTATFEFSHTVTGFVLSDIEVGNGTASDFTPMFPLTPVSRR